MSDPSSFLDASLSEAKSAAEVRRAYAQAIALDPTATPTDLRLLMTMRETRMQELEDGVVHRPQSEDRSGGERQAWREAYAAGQRDGDYLREWMDHLSFEGDEQRAQFATMLDAYPAWVEWRQSADAPEKSVKLLEQWMRYGHDEDTRRAFLANQTQWDTTVTSLRARPALYRLVGPFLVGDVSAGRPVTRRAPASAPLATPPIGGSSRPFVKRITTFGKLIWVLFFLWVLFTVVWFFYGDDEKDKQGRAGDEAPASPDDLTPEERLKRLIEEERRALEGG